MDNTFFIKRNSNLQQLAWDLVNWTEYQVALPEIWLQVRSSGWRHLINPREVEAAWDNCQDEAIEKYEDPALLMHRWFTSHLEPLWSEIQQQLNSDV